MPPEPVPENAGLSRKSSWAAPAAPADAAFFGPRPRVEVEDLGEVGHGLVGLAPVAAGEEAGHLALPAGVHLGISLLY